MLHQINPNMEYERNVEWTNLPPGWYILNAREVAQHPTVVGPFDTEGDVQEYCDDTSSLFDTERIIQVR